MAVLVGTTFSCPWSVVAYRVSLHPMSKNLNSMTSTIDFTVVLGSPHPLGCSILGFTQFNLIMLVCNG